MKLYGYWRSSASWRVRAALALKGVEFEHVGVHLVKDGGQQHDSDYRERNPMAQVPTLEVEQDGQVFYIGQSMAILEYLEERFPQPSLLPADAIGRARARQLAEIVNSGIHPLQNLSVLTKIREELGGDERGWGKQVIEQGLRAYEKVAHMSSGRFSVGDAVSFADICLVPQLYNARRFAVETSEFKLLERIETSCMELEAFQVSHPSQQPDAV